MCGIAGVLQLSGRSLPDLERRLQLMNELQRHRGPDGEGIWCHPNRHVGLAHRRLSVIDLTTGAQPMSDAGGNWIVHNGEVYNYLELREQLDDGTFRTTSDTEVVLAAYRRWQAAALTHLRGMFALAVWDEAGSRLFCARDRFGIKPLYYARTGDLLYFASEVKAILPFLPHVGTDWDALKDFLAFQFCLGGKTLFDGVSELPPGHLLEVSHGGLVVRPYWQARHDLDFEHTPRYFEARLHDLIDDAVRLHLRSDVPVGAYLSGGLDSSIVASVASANHAAPLMGFTGAFPEGPAFDERPYAREIAAHCGCPLIEVEIGVQDFIDHITSVIYHLDYPVAGPGSFPQFMVSREARRHRTVVLGGQGGDEVFGGYVRYLIAYFEQCIKAAIDGTMDSGHFIVTYESIIPNLTALRAYKPLLQSFWSDGLFDEMDQRYFRLINRTPTLDGIINWDLLSDYSPFDTFRSIFHASNIQKESYFDLMTHFDFKTLLPALLHVEDRVSMAHGLESRVPLLDHPIVEFAATMPSSVKFQNGTLKQVLKRAMAPRLPPGVAQRTDKMGFPTPVNAWLKGPAGDFARDVLTSSRALGREVVDNQRVAEALDDESTFGRQIWGLLSLELWQQQYHDRARSFDHLTTEACRP